MTNNEIKKYIYTTHRINIMLIDIPDFDDSYDYIKRIDDFVYNYEMNNIDVDIEFFTGCAACFPHLICESGIKKECTKFIKVFISFVEGKGIKVSL